MREDDLIALVLKDVPEYRLRKIARAANLVKRGNRDSCAHLVGVIVAARLGLRAVLEAMQLPELQAACVSVGLSSRARQREQLVKRLLEHAAAPSVAGSIVNCDVWDGLPLLQPIYADMWRLPLIQRLLGSTTYSERPVEVIDSFREQGTPTPVLGTMAFRWEGVGADFGRYAGRTEQDHRTTEHAALALACVAVATRASKRITEVTRLGDKADYWIGNREQLLEVGGEVGCDLDALREDKRKQLLENPHDLDGYVCVVDFAQKRSYLWHFAQESSEN